MTVLSVESEPIESDVSLDLAPKEKKPLLQIKGLTKEFEGQAAVDKIDLTINQGEIFALLGASGCGKSTLLRMLAGFESPTQGQIILDGQDLSKIPPYKRPVNMMFQSYALFPHMTVFNNIAFGLKQDGISKKEIQKTVEELLKLVHMTEYANRKPHQLSGGQRQRVALARSLAKKPKLLLLDEPMGALDKNLRERMQLEIVDILERVGVTCVMVTHDQEEAMTMAHRIAIMNKGQFVQIGAPESIYESPNSRFSAQFIGSVNIFEGVLETSRSDRAEIACRDISKPIILNHGISATPGTELMVAVRPEKMFLCHETLSQGNTCSGIVEDIAYLGSQSIYHVRLPSGKLVIASVQNVSRVNTKMPTWNDPISLYWEMDSGVVLTI
ncbi:polyamine ABC transporter ATP-binding protein [Vibrio sp.]|uniref:Spermidine/putrescine import ATP-binding protein PotA n=1 Tax=Vibrio viridaestus TaxID=2487322 RepID=A0A3N9TKS6_9VIBR|nr:polyamine ABC transporter ATP-binding protein [Vibrio viridaestus]MDC0611679.1 polyamine ABC transporter ATP-binding protein [Vibrio sp.]RQW64185.1 polyamine ABC transporter ATP-binding protein [Vibrio viridaestus]